MPLHLPPDLPKRDYRLLSSILIGLGVILLLYLSYALPVVAFPYPLDYGEGPILDQALRLAQGENIYSAIDGDPPYVITNYPPLYMAIIAVFVKLFGSAFAYGRLISLLSTLAAALCLGGVAYNLTHYVLPAVTGGLLFLALPAVFYWSPWQRVDMLGLAFSLAALYAATCRPLTRQKVVLTVLLMLSAIFTRQTYGLAAPLAITGALGQRNRRQSLAFLLLLGSGGLTILSALNIVTHGGFIANIVTGNINIYTLDVLAHFIGQYLGWLLPMVLVLLMGMPGLIKQHTRLGAPVLYLAGGFAVSLTVGKHGSSLNYFLEFSAAMALVAALLVNQTIQSKPSTHRAPRTIMLLLLFGQVVWLLILNAVYTVNYVGTMAASRAAYQQLDSIVANATGPILTDEYLGLLPLHNRPIYFQPFEYTQLVLVGRWDQTPLLEAITNQQFPIILAAHMETPYAPWTPEMIAAIEEHYHAHGKILKALVYTPASP